MLSKHNKAHRHQLQMVTIDDLVPADHLVRKIEASIDFDFIYDFVEELYSLDQGRPSIDPVVFIKIALIQLDHFGLFLNIANFQIRCFCTTPRKGGIKNFMKLTAKLKDMSPIQYRIHAQRVS